MQGIQNLGLARVEGLAALPALRQIDHHFVGIRIGDVADLLDHAVAQALLRQPLAQLVHRRRAGEAHINQRAALEIDAVIQTAFVNPRGRPDEQQRQRQGEEILRLAHPVKVNVVVKKLHADTCPSLVRHRPQPLLCPAAIAGSNTQGLLARASWPGANRKSRAIRTRR